MGKIMIPTEDNDLLSVSCFKSGFENAAGIVRIVHGTEKHKERCPSLFYVFVSLSQNTSESTRCRY